MVSRNSFKFVMLPPQTDTTRGWAKRLAEAVPEVRVVLAEDADTAAREIADAEAAFGWLGKELLSKATNLRWLTATKPAASSAPGKIRSERVKNWCRSTMASCRLSLPSRSAVSTFPHRAGIAGVDTGEPCCPSR